MEFEKSGDICIHVTSHCQLAAHATLVQLSSTLPLPVPFSASRSPLMCHPPATAAYVDAEVAVVAELGKVLFEDFALGAARLIETPGGEGEAGVHHGNESGGGSAEVQSVGNARHADSIYIRALHPSLSAAWSHPKQSSRPTARKHYQNISRRKSSPSPPFFSSTYPPPCPTVSPPCGTSKIARSACQGAPGLFLP